MKPGRDEYAEYYHRYVSQVPEGDILETLERQVGATASLLREASADTAAFRYAPGKWSTKEVVGHVVDVEWVFTLRSLVFARGDTTPWPGMDQDRFVAGANFADRSLPDILDELQRLRAANLTLFRSFDEPLWSRRGTASDVEFTVRSIPWILAGHELHHVGVLKDRYLAR